MQGSVLSARGENNLVLGDDGVRYTPTSTPTPTPTVDDRAGSAGEPLAGYAPTH